MIAAYRLKGIGWFGACTTIVLGFYLVSLQVASERKKLEHLDSDIASTRRDIRALETEFDTRANLAQLERWNGDTLALAAPQPAQFLRSEAELADADVVRGPGAPAVRTAALVVPSLSVQPATAPAAAPAALVAVASARAAASPAPSIQPVERNARLAGNGTKAPGTARAALARMVARPIAASVAALRSPTSDGEAAARPAPLGERRQVALLDRKLLSDTTLRDLIGGARAEGGKLR